MAKKGRKAQESADRSELAASVSGGAPSFAGVGTRAIRIDQARGVPICLGAWTSFGGAAEDPTRIAIQEWSKEDRTWTVIEVIRPATLGRDQFPPLQPENFAGRYDRERVLTVFKVPEKPAP